MTAMNDLAMAALMHDLWLTLYALIIIVVGAVVLAFAGTWYLGPDTDGEGK